MLFLKKGIMWLKQCDWNIMENGLELDVPGGIMILIKNLINRVF